MRAGKGRLVAIWTVFVALSMIAVGAATAQTSDDGAVTVTVTPNVIEFNITNGTVAFGNQNAGATTDTTAGTAPTVNNTGGLELVSLTATFDAASEATCVGGGSWEANATTPTTDVFVLDAADDGEFTTDSVNIPPNPTASGNILETNIAATSGTREIDLEMQVPTAFTTGNNECTIAMTLTGSSS